MIWILAGFTIFFALSAVMNALDDNDRGFWVHGWISFVLLVVTVTHFFFTKP